MALLFQISFSVSMRPEYQVIILRNFSNKWISISSLFMFNFRFTSDARGRTFAVDSYLFNLIHTELFICLLSRQKRYRSVIRQKRFFSSTLMSFKLKSPRASKHLTRQRTDRFFLFTNKTNCIAHSAVNRASLKLRGGSRYTSIPLNITKQNDVFFLSSTRSEGRELCSMRGARI